MAALIEMLLLVFWLLILARILMSWVQVDPYNPVAQFIYNATEPFLKPVRDVLPPAGGFDFSPIVVLILAQVIGSILVAAVS
ncbi:MAG: YggT family protein [Anaerolineales bacterium]